MGDDRLSTAQASRELGQAADRTARRADIEHDRLGVGIRDRLTDVLANPLRGDGQPIIFQDQRPRHDHAEHRNHGNGTLLARGGAFSPRIDPRLDPFDGSAQPVQPALR